MSDERIGVLGGTFDPIHVGHVVAAVWTRWSLGLDRMLLVPAGDPWQKRGQVTAPATDRLAMVAAAIDGIEGLEASSIEVQRDGPSYTVDTLEALTRPDRSLFLVVGEDVVAGLHTWVRVERIPDLATLVVVSRAGMTAAGVDLGPGWRVEQVFIPHIDISSSDLRARAAEGAPLDGLVPPGAVRVMQERRLYN